MTIATNTLTDPPARRGLPPGQLLDNFQPSLTDADTGKGANIDIRLKPFPTVSPGYTATVSAAR